MWIAPSRPNAWFEAQADLFLTIDRSDYHASDRLSRSSSYRSELLRLGRFPRRRDFGDHRESELANESQRLGVHARRWDLWRPHGEFEDFLDRQLRGSVTTSAQNQVLIITRQEYLLTLGIASDSSSVATIMIYSQVLWALVLDRIFWHLSMNVWTFVGVGNVIGSLTLVSLAKEISPLRSPKVLYEAVATSDDNGVTVHEIDLDSLDSSESSEGQV